MSDRYGAAYARLTRWDMGGVYLESGLVDIGNVLLEDPTDGPIYRAPDDFTFDPASKGLPALPVKRLLKPGNGDPSDALGLPESRKEHPSDEKLQAQKTKLIQKKLIATFMPPSLYDGKMKLFVQAIYGAHIDKWRGILDVSGSQPNWSLDEVTLHYVYTADTGIVTHRRTVGQGEDAKEVQEYYLVRLILGRVHVRRLVLSGTGRRLIDYLIQWEPSLSQKERLDIEALALATASIDSHDYDLAEYAIIGDPYHHHGWAWNWKGTEAHLVAHELIEVVQATQYKRKARHYRLRFTPNDHYDFTDPNSLPLSVQFDTLEIAEYNFDLGEVNLSYYRYDEGGEWPVITPISSNNPFGDAPIYCWFEPPDIDGDDDLMEWRYSYAFDATGTPNPGGAFPTLRMCGGCAGGSCNSYLVPGYEDDIDSESVEYAWGNVKNRGFYSDKYDSRRAIGDNYYRRSRQMTVTPDGTPAGPVYDGTNYNSSTISGPAYCGFFGGFDPLPYHGGTLVGETANYHLTTFIDDRSSTTGLEIFAVIPGYDRKAFYIGTFETIPARTVTDKTEGAPNSGYRTHFWASFPGQQIGQVGIYEGGWSSSFSSSGMSTTERDDSGAMPETFERKVYLITASADDPLLISLESDTDYYSASGSWEPFFEINMAEPSLIPLQLIVQSSLHESYFYTGGDDGPALETDEEEYQYVPSKSWVGRA